MSSKTFFVANFGCRASQSEGASIEQQLMAAAASADSPFHADVVVVNTCTVTEEADREARQLMRRIASRNPDARIIVTGCYAQRAPDELAILDGVSHVVGNSHKPMVGQLALKVLQSDLRPVERNGRAEVFCSDIFLEEELRPESHLGSGGRTRAVVKVQDGCNANCSFCIIPSVRGRSRSLSPASVVEEITELVDRGYKEVVLSGIHLGSYGRDLDRNTNLRRLIDDILENVPKLERLRLSSIEPLEVTPELVALVVSDPRLAHHFHIPLQSGSSRVLRAMRRPYQPEYYLDLVRRIRSEMDDASIGADVMVGFPGETDEEFFETFRLIEDAPLTYLHVFPYSARPGTPAAEFKPQVPDHVSSFRAKSLRQLIARKNAAFLERMRDRELDVLVLHEGEGLTGNFLKVHLEDSLPVNEWVRLRITGIGAGGLSAASVFSSSNHSGYLAGL